MDTILWYMEITWDYVMQMLPCAILGAVGFFCLRLWRKKWLAAEGLKSGAGRDGAMLFFVLFAAGLSALTLFPSGFFDQVYLYFRHGWPITFRSVSEGFYWKITIFEELVDCFLGPHVAAWPLYMLLGNIIMFIPFGFFPALIGDKPRWWKTILTGFCVSAFIEIVQLFVGRSSDINDIILNTFGALCGFGVYLLLKRLAPKFTARFKLQKTEVPHGCETGN